MLRVALTRLSKSSSVVAGGIYRSGHPILRPVSTATRLFCATDSHVDASVLKTINFVLGHARSQKTDKSYAASLLMLEQLSQEVHDGATEDLKGMVLLAVSTLLYERGNIDEAIQTLQRIQELSCSSSTQFAAIEALVGLNLELGLEDNSSVILDNGFKCFDKEAQQIRDGSGITVLNARAKAIKGLVELVRSDLDSAKTFFQGCEDEDFTDCLGNVALSYGEFLHVKGDYAAAKEVYKTVISGSNEKKDFSSDPRNMAACSMSLQEVLLAATCALGQLQSHLGDFEDAAGTLAKALKLAEEHFGSNNPKFGIVLTSIALLQRYMDISKGSSSIVIQEGLHRLVIKLLKAPPLERDGAMEAVAKRDIAALARGVNAVTLLQGPNFHLHGTWKLEEEMKVVGERMKNWAEASWRSCRLSLDEALDISDRSKVPVIDTWICRVL